MNPHPTDERLNDWVDGLLEAADAEAVAAHVAGCAACQADAERLRALLSLTGALPAAIDPPVGTWEAIAARTVDLGRTRREVLRGMRIPLAAAAAVLVAVTAGATALLLRAEATAETPVVASAPEPMIAGGGVLVAAEDTYQRQFEQLITEFRANRASLDSTTVAVVEENLAIIETALVQARAALAADPANADLPLLITKTHRQRIALIERALRLSMRPDRSEA